MSHTRHLSLSRPYGIFITGTDTNVGKTVITASLGIALRKQGFRLGVMKPIETGWASSGQEAESDCSRLHNLFTPEHSEDMITPYRFPDPLAPLAASRRVKRPIDVTIIKDRYQELSKNCDIVLVEGAGGVMVPLTEHQTVRDLINALQIPCIIVSKPTLGGVNHALLTLEALHTRKIEVLAMVLNHASFQTTSEIEQLQIETTIQLIRELSGAPVIGPLIFEPMLKKEWVEGVGKIANDQGITQLAELVLKKV